MLPLVSCIANSSEDIAPELMDGLTFAVTESHYTALIQQTKISTIDLPDSDTSDDYAEVKHTIADYFYENPNRCIKELKSPYESCLC